jgi:recombination protein RecR
MFSPLIQELIDALRSLPGVGQRSAQRMAFHLLERDRIGGVALGHALLHTLEKVGQCQRCRNLSETPICTICQHPGREQQLLCIVESPADVLAIEQTGSYKGLYFVLMGHLSPLDGIGPQTLGLDLLVKHCSQSVSEVILATNLTVEGEATAHYISHLLKNLPLKLSRIAHGVPTGGELEYIDSGTLSRALAARALVP